MRCCLESGRVQTGDQQQPAHVRCCYLLHHDIQILAASNRCHCPNLSVLRQQADSELLQYLCEVPWPAAPTLCLEAGSNLNASCCLAWHRPQHDGLSKSYRPTGSVPDTSLFARQGSGISWSTVRHMAAAWYTMTIVYTGIHNFDDCWSRYAWLIPVCLMRITLAAGVAFLGSGLPFDKVASQASRLKKQRLQRPLRHRHRFITDQVDYGMGND